MTPGVSEALEQLRRCFSESDVTVTPDSNGGAYAIVEVVNISSKYLPSTTWIGGHLVPTLPYGDVYPLFIGGDVRRANGQPFTAPITLGTFQGRVALQISRRTNRHDPQLQTAARKFAKVLHWLRTEA
jgi:hypothetical protein